MQVNAYALQGQSTVVVLCEDTGVFALLCYFYRHIQWKTDVYMHGFSLELRDSISIVDKAESLPISGHLY